MGVIRILDAAVANQIAAGEVVERPASVVRELVENSLDAGARRIDVTITDGGVTRIAVADDGVGMSRDDAALAFDRHATSKIATAADLARIATFGFRGEALPSIASVARVTLTTRPSADDAATEIRIAANRIESVRNAGAPPGTTIVVDDLFFNTPARRHFLKSTATEAARVTDTVRRHALVRPDVHFNLIHITNGGRRERIAAPPAATLRDRARALFHDEVGELYPFDHVANGIRAHGLFAEPSQSVATSEGISLFVNNRPVRDKMLSHAVLSGFQSLLERGRYPFVILFVEADPSVVDVNVHPQKNEVRFADTRPIYSAVSGALASALAAAPWLAARDPNARPYVITRSAAAGQYFPAAHANRAAGGSQTAFGALAANATRSDAPPISPPRPVSESETPTSIYSSCHFLAQHAATYLVCAVDADIVLIDQHAAHERVCFERLRNARAAHPQLQRLLLPEPLDLRDDLAAAAVEHESLLSAAGFDFATLDRVSIVLKAVPAALVDHGPVETFVDLLAELANASHTRAIDNARDRVDATIACHAAVRAGDPLSQSECEALLRDLAATPNNGNCPHGRPIIARLDGRDIARRFHRP